MLIVHHLGISQSERIVWLCEELALDYELKRYTRDPLLAPAALKTLPGNDIGTAPVLQDGDVVLAESGAIVEWIIHRHGGGRLACAPSDANYADYLRWFHFANATLQSIVGRTMLVAGGGDGDARSNVLKKNTQDRLRLVLTALDRQLAQTTFLAGAELTAADIMTVFSLSNMRYFAPIDLNPYPNIVRYLGVISRRPAYQRAMAKGDPGLELLVTGDPPKQTLFEIVKQQQQQQQQQQRDTGSKLS